MTRLLITSLRAGLGAVMRHTGLWVLLALLLPAAADAQVNVLTSRYDGARTSANLSETTLTPFNVNVAGFAKLYSYPVDGAVYAQPLYVGGLTIGGTTRNVVFLATMNDKVYAFDADSPSPVPLWVRDFTGPPSVTAVPIADIASPNLNITGNVGVESTPVIDASSGTMYLVARTRESTQYVQKVHALDIRTGLERSGSPVTIQGSVPGTAPDAIDGTLTFNPKMQNQRAGLALTNGVVLVAWSSHEDLLPYHGWIMGYDATTLARVAIFTTTPDVAAGGIWQGARGPTLDASGNAYYSTGDALWDGSRNWGDSLLKFSVSTNGLGLLDYFTPGNNGVLNRADLDLSGSGFTLIPGTNLMLGGGKEGVLYLVNSANLGHSQNDDTQIPQRIDVGGGHLLGGPVYWNSSSLGGVIYNWSENDVLRAYRFNGSRLTMPAYASGTDVSPGHPGGSLTLSANGNAAGSGIVWAYMPTNQSGIHGLVAGILRAYHAETLEQLWSSEDLPQRDRVGTFVKFVAPVVANGKVYVPSQDNAVMVYGLLPATPDVTPNVP